MKNPNCNWCGIELTAEKLDSRDFGTTYFCGECYEKYKQSKIIKNDSIIAVIARINQPGYVEAWRDCIDILTAKKLIIKRRRSIWK